MGWHLVNLNNFWSARGKQAQLTRVQLADVRSPKGHSREMMWKIAATNTADFLFTPCDYTYKSPEIHMHIVFELMCIIYLSVFQQARYLQTTALGMQMSCNFILLQLNVVFILSLYSNEWPNTVI